MRAALAGCLLTAAALAHAADATISWGLPPSPVAVTINVGESVTWNGDLWRHPLIGTDPSFTTIGPVEDSSGTSFARTFSAPGTFHFMCAVHGAQMATTVTVALPISPPTLVQAASRKAHGSSGSFDLALNHLPTNPTTEPRGGPAHTVVFKFDKTVTSGMASVTEGTATAGAPTLTGSEMIVPLADVANQQYVTVIVSNVASADGGAGGSGSVRVGFLQGDVSQNRTVTVSDVAQVNAQIAQPVTAGNYLKDVNATGSLSVADKGITNAQVTKALPEPGLGFRFAGTNNFYLMYKSRAMIDDVLETAASAKFTVLRTWGSVEIGNQDGSNSINGKADGVYFQFWDGSAPAYNDGPDGLQRLDYVIAKARQTGVRLIIPFTNNWNSFGGMDQYVRWRGGSHHDDFYTDATIRQWFKNWIAHVLNRVNPLTGLAYKDDPTVLMWELANEPRCISAGAYPRSPNCTTQTLVDWASEMSAHVKSIDHKHLVSVGDEGWYCIPGATDWWENCWDGVDTLAFGRLPTIDAMSFHLYGDPPSRGVAWGTQWIQRHLQDARRIGKPVILGEFGWPDRDSRNVAFKQWTDAFFLGGGAGALYWMLAGDQDDGTPYPDFDGFTVYCPSPVCIALTNFSEMMANNQASAFEPVADDDSATVELNVHATLYPVDNDIAYGGASVLGSSIDLDPVTDGQQTVMPIAAGTFVLQPDGTVRFAPESGFSGSATTPYTVMDSAGRISNLATLGVLIKPDPAAPIKLFSFESGTEGWALGNWLSGANTVTQSTNHATDGSHSLKVTSTAGGWFGKEAVGLANLTGKTRLKVDLTTVDGTSTNVALRLGSSMAWCQGFWGWVNPGGTTTIDIDLLNLDICTSPDLSGLHGIYVWFSGGTHYIDNIRAE